MARFLVPVLILVFLVSSAAGEDAAREGPPAWPLNLDTRYLTGNFMEPRGGRFHTGLDLKTNSRTGYAVVAVRDGWISRVRFATGGYGKAVYLRGDDGLTYVYGHLGRLADGLREYVRAQQRRRGAYELDLALDPGAWPVVRGDVLALSGQSGTSGPHLHFEVRAADGSPLDPQAHGFAVADTMAPEILAVRVVASDDPEAPTLRWGDGEDPLCGRLPDVFVADGRVRFTARIVERSDRLRYRLGAWRVRLWADGREVFVSRNDRLAWRRNRQQRLEYVNAPLGQERWLWQDPRVTLEGRASADRFGVASLPPGRHLLRLEAADRAGNQAAVEWVVDVDPGLPAGADPGWHRDGSVHPEPWLVAAGAGPLAAGVYSGLEPPVQWRRGRPLEAPTSQRLQLAGLAALGEAVHFRTVGPELLDPVEVLWPDAAAGDLAIDRDATVAVYRLEDDGWSYETELRESPQGPVFDLDRSGVLGLMRDTAAPVIATAPVTTTLRREAERRRHGITLPRWPVVRIPVGDHGSGVDWTSLEVSLDGEGLVAEPDAPRDRVLVELPDGLPPGRHRLVVAVSDRAGHRRQAGLDLELQDPEEP